MPKKIKGLTNNISFRLSAEIILKFRYNEVRKKSRDYLHTDTIENLHDLRISFRRLRYSLENYEICFNKKEHKLTLDYLKFMQDLIGEGRDLDVLEEKIKQLSKENNLEIPASLFNKIVFQKEEIKHNIKLELMKFLNDKRIKSFFNTKS
ncbi:MAG: CHAD domain-containing protein [Ignavibacteriales bacterium]|nr:MAG: CHAD domain-containing protein [Ignavibacteriales bacterium]